MAHAENRGRRLRQCNSFARDQWLSNGQKEVHRTQKKSHQMKQQQDPRSVIIGAGVGAHPPQPNPTQQKPRPVITRGRADTDLGSLSLCRIVGAVLLCVAPPYFQ